MYLELPLHAGIDQPRAYSSVRWCCSGASAPGALSLKDHTQSLYSKWD